MLHLTYHRATRTPTINFFSFFSLFENAQCTSGETFALPGTEIMCAMLCYLFYRKTDKRTERV